MNPTPERTTQRKPFRRRVVVALGLILVGFLVFLVATHERRDESLFEGRRVVHFGRAPGAGAPGELPTEKKWEHVRRALSFLRPENGARDWSLVDARWDVADVAWRLPPDPDAPADSPATKSKSKPPAPRKP